MLELKPVQDVWEATYLSNRTDMDGMNIVSNVVIVGKFKKPLLLPIKLICLYLLSQ